MVSRFLRNGGVRDAGAAMVAVAGAGRLAFVLLGDCPECGCCLLVDGEAWLLALVVDGMQTMITLMREVLSDLRLHHHLRHT
jgi:hypothetical protein